MKKVSLTASALALTLGLAVALGGGVALAKGNGHAPTTHGPTKVAASGTPMCNVHGIVIINANGAVSFRGNVTHSGSKCVSATSAKSLTGHFSSALTSPATTPTSTSTTLCIPVPAGTLAALSNGAIAWNPRAKVAPSTGINLTTGSASTSSDGHLVITYTGSVSDGSFSKDGVSLALTSNQTMTQLGARCASNRFVIAVRGTITFTSVA